MNNFDRFAVKVRARLMGHLSVEDVRKVVAVVERIYTEEIPSEVSKADMEEPLFVVRGQDESAEATVDFWIDKNIDKIPDEKFLSAMKNRAAMIAWPKKKQAD